jgi:hypothetical protein
VKGVRVPNVSVGGVQFLLDIPIPRGELLTVEFHRRSCKPTRARQVRVAYTREAPEGGFLVGATFSPELTYDEVDELL